MELSNTQTLHGVLTKTNFKKATERHCKSNASIRHTSLNWSNQIFMVSNKIKINPTIDIKDNHTKLQK